MNLYKYIAPNLWDILEYLDSDEQYSMVKKYVAVLDEREFKLNMIVAEVQQDESK
jgi:hypothetical protein